MTTSTNRFFNGSILNFNGTPVLHVVGISYKDGGNWIDVTEPEDLTRIYQLATQDDLEVQVKYKGSCTLTRGAVGTLSITWSDGSSSTCSGNWQVGPVDKTGDWDAPVTGSASLRPTVPSAA